MTKNVSNARNDRLDHGWKTVQSPKEMEDKTGNYKGGSSDMNAPNPPKVD
jgi:hypothetical protein